MRSRLAWPAASRCLKPRPRAHGWTIWRVWAAPAFRKPAEPASASRPLRAAGPSPLRSFHPVAATSRRRDPPGQLARRADVLARRLDAGDACAAKAEAASLRRETAAALPRVPQRLRATLSQDVDALVARIPACAPSEPPRAPAKPKPVKHHEDKHGHGKKHH
jgi:hypothetical protein